MVLNILKRGRKNRLRPARLGRGLPLSAENISNVFKQQPIYLQPAQDLYPHDEDGGSSSEESCAWAGSDNDGDNDINGDADNASGYGGNVDNVPGFSGHADNASRFRGDPDDVPRFHGDVNNAPRFRDNANNASGFGGANNAPRYGDANNEPGFSGHADNAPRDDADDAPYFQGDANNAPGFGDDDIDVPHGDLLPDGIPPTDNNLLVSDSTVVNTLHDDDTDTPNQAFHLSDALQLLRAQINEEETFIIRTVRGNEFYSSAANFAEEYTELHNKLKVRFVNENGIDNGGLTREFLQLALNHVQNSSIFIKNDDVAVANRIYFSAGAVIAFCLVYGGPSPNFFNDYHVQYILTGISAEGERDDCIGTNETGFQQFLNGLSVMNTLSTMRQHPDLFRSLFVNIKKSLDVDEFLDLFEDCRSTLGSNRFKIESRVHALFTQLLQSIANGQETRISFKCILRHTTGLEMPPEIGFVPKPKLRYYHERVMCQFPMFGTCEMYLQLPVFFTKMSEYEQFREEFVTGVLNSIPFSSA